MISNINIKQAFDGMLSDCGDVQIDTVGGRNGIGVSGAENYSIATANASGAMASPGLTTPTTNALRAPQSVTTNNSFNTSTVSGFSIYNRNIDFEENYTSTYSNTLFTKDSNINFKTSQMEPNLLLNTNVNTINKDSLNSEAVRKVENVHNYSKMQMSDDDRDVEEHDDVDKDIGDGVSPEKGQSNDDEKSTPDHHARRPMNAFLIFCKRHRAIVREKYPNLENRSITRILGDWWANLDNEEKTSYTNLAKQYKDAFFDANPNFKWYKLPAPPLRTLTTRPSNTDRPLPSYDNYRPAKHLSDFMSAVIKSDDGVVIKRKIRPSNVGIFKLADETQMGGLSSLMISYDPKSKSSNNNLGEDDDDTGASSPSSELQNALGETSYYIAKTMSNDRTEPYTQYRFNAARLQSNPAPTENGSISEECFPPAKRKNDDEHEEQVKRIALDEGTPTKHNEEFVTSPIDFERFVLANSKLATPEKQLSFEYDEDGNKKTSRACKGKRYLEFMNTGKINAYTKKPKNQATSPGGFLQNDYYKYGPRIEYEICDHMYASPAKPNYELTKTEENSAAAMMSLGVDANLKLFDASDFDLEDKIKALPALSLEKYLSRKRDTKKKKKINSKRIITTTKSPQTIQEAKEQIRSSMVGSQKRKARKESITRRDVSQIENNLSPLSPIASIVASNNGVAFVDRGEDGFTEKPSDGTSDLLILATIAEVAATYEHKDV